MGTYSYQANTIQTATVGTAPGDLAPGVYKITAYGAQGGNWGGEAGAKGSEYAGTFTLTAGEKLEVIVGGQGGAGGAGVTYGGAGGGGGSFVLANTGSGYKPLLIAGGGGGAGSVNPGQTSALDGSGGSGGMGGLGYAPGGGGGGGGTGLSSVGQKGVNGSYGGGNGGAHYAGGTGGTGTNVGARGGFGGGGGGGGGGSAAKGAGYSGGGGGGGGYNGGNGGTAGYTDPGVNSAGAYGGDSGSSIDKGSPLIGIGGERAGNGLVLIQTAACYRTGTLIRTSRGDVAVETLRVGDHAVTASGASRPIVWIGHRDLDGHGELLPHDAQPIRVRAGAFGPGLPARDLRLSPGHPVLVGADADFEGGVLVPIMCLVNGTSIARERATSVTYWHVELDSHDVLLAEGLAAESYYDMGSRAWFAGETSALFDPDFVPAGAHGRCRPVAIEGAPVEAERKRLDAVFAAELTAHCAWSGADAWSTA